MKALLRRHAALAALLSIVGRHPARATPACPATLDMSMEIEYPVWSELDSDAALRYAVVPSDPPGAGNGLFCARLEVEDVEELYGIRATNEWVSLAFGEWGYDDHFVVIGLDGTVQKYAENSYVCRRNLLSSIRPSSTLRTEVCTDFKDMIDEKQTLVNTSITKDGNVTIMSFAKLLVEECELKIANGTNDLSLIRGGFLDRCWLKSPLCNYRTVSFSLELDLPVDETDITKPGSGCPADDVDAPQEPSSSAAMVGISVVASCVSGAIWASLKFV